MPVILGDLEFKAEDFDWIDDGSGRPPQAYADYSNRLLRERLGKAPVWYRHNEGASFGATTCYRAHPQYFKGERIPGREARLVCIEEIGPGCETHGVPPGEKCDKDTRY